MPRFPVAFRPPAFASRSSCSRRGVRPSSRSAYRPRRPDPGGVTAFRTHEQRPGWAPSIPRGRRCSSRTERTAQPAPAALPRLVLQPRSNIPPCEAPLYEASTRVQAIRPSGLPLAYGRPDGTGRRLGFPPSFAPRRPGAGRRTSRWGQAIEHGPGTTRSTHISRSPIR
jgi:hypothetical protein